jgi:FtsH-binding integral membrane protein
MTNTTDALVATRPVAGAAFDEGLRRHMLRVYNYMTLGLIITGAVAFRRRHHAGVL